jgi:uncharacterized protein (DUF934 family)
MPLIKDGRLVDDPWVDVADGEPLPEDGPVIVSLERWASERTELLRRGRGLGVRLKSDQQPEALRDDLSRLDLVALEFPAFTDGRAYSNARLLRERYGFTGELRAVGNVLRDQFLFMHRCGFDAFAVADRRAADGWRQAMSEIEVYYQPATDGRTPVGASRLNQSHDRP